MVAAVSIQDKAKEAATYFEVAKRTGAAPEEYVKVKDSAPEWVRAIVYAAHGKDANGTPSFLPEDYRYRLTRDALDYIAESLDEGDPNDTDWDHFEERADDFADQADTYTSDLLAWLGSNLRRIGYVDQWLEDYYGSDRPRHLADAIRGGQYLERREVFELVREALERIAGE